LLVLIPSIYFGYLLVQKEKFNENATGYVNSIRVFEGNYLLDSDINSNTKSITLIYGGVSLTEEQKMQIKNEAPSFGLEEVTIDFRQGISLDALPVKSDEEQQLLNQIGQLTNRLKEKDLVIDSLSRFENEGKQILGEISILFPEITSCSFAKAPRFQKDTAPGENLLVIVFSTSGKPLKKTDQDKIFEWLKTKLKTDNLRVYYDFK
jgi:hypothetical protein